MNTTILISTTAALIFVASIVSTEVASARTVKVGRGISGGGAKKAGCH